ncbi:hypothetical protein [Rothia nasimurium]|uniref:hypothetical protein n=1 Tax=Rothia nasimurium TaxID=85336 RepID=UPI001F197A1F|nr:hypothetical protein [Rothia nasimurium]
MKIDTSNISDLQYSQVLKMARNIATLADLSMPTLKNAQLEQTLSKLHVRSDPAKNALDAVLAGNPAEAVEHIREIALDRVRMESAEVEAIRRVTAQARDVVRAEDTKTLCDYIEANFEAARLGFNKKVEGKSATWHEDKDAKPTDLTEPAEVAYELYDLARTLAGYKIPKYCHPITRGAMHAGYSAPTLMGDPREPWAKVRDAMGERPKPGGMVELYWKSPKEFEAEHKAYEAMLQKLGDEAQEDIPVYEYWLNKKK